jgi:two-component system, NtrC family, response regulator
MPYGNVLVVEDENKFRFLLQRIISREGYKTYEAADCKSAACVLKRNEIEVVVCDVRLPDGDGLDFTRRVKSSFAHIEIILLTAYGTIADGVEAMRNGAFDYITKGDDHDKLLPLVHRAMDKARLQKKVTELEQELKKDFNFDRIIGTSPAIQETILQAKKVALTEATVLLLGETGTGKELLARAIHGSGSRAGWPFIALNCSAFNGTLMESELFGHVAGAFTGATHDKSGLLEEAHGGTLFLDEIAELNLNVQAKLLRILETWELRKLGSTKPFKVNVRIVAATNSNMDSEIEAGRFRKDLFYRLNAFMIRLPSLREREEDILLLAQYFLDLFSRKIGKPLKEMSNIFTEQLKLHHWKGNIRELRNVMERGVILANGKEMTMNCLPPEFQKNHYKRGNVRSVFDLDNMEKIHIERVLQYTHGNKVDAARLMNIGLTTLYRKLKAYHLSLSKGKKSDN